MNVGDISWAINICLGIYGECLKHEKRRNKKSSTKQPLIPNLGWCGWWDRACSVWLWSLQKKILFVLKIPPKEAVSDVVGKLKGKAAIRLANEFSKQKNWYTNKSFWSTGYFVRTIWIDAEIVKKYVRDQEDKDKREDGNQIDLGL